MTRKDYELIARAMLNARPKQHWDANKHAQFRVCASRIADALESENSRFDRARFIAACGIDE